MPTILKIHVLTTYDSYNGKIQIELFKRKQYAKNALKKQVEEAMLVPFEEIHSMSYSDDDIITEDKVLLHIGSRILCWKILERPLRER